MPFNPFPGLRPFEREEDHLFFGREPDVDALLARLRTSRFVSVIGASGCGKSSLVRSGLIPSLLCGSMAGAGSSWHIATMRPGEDPIRYLARALNEPGVLGANDELADTRDALLEASLRRGTRGLISAVTEARLPASHNVLVLVDQFEELFRFRRSGAAARDGAIAFVRTLLEAAAQRPVPIHIVITMRSDFIGDCMDFPGLPEAINSGMHLVGRMDRDALRSAITGPIAVAGGRIAPRLVSRILNEIADDQDQLPRMQHALMRTWDHWQARGGGAGEIDIDDYEAVGTLEHALSRHADETFAEAVRTVDAGVVERMFKALTDLHSDPRGVRRPTTVADLAEICGTDASRIISAVEVFRDKTRCFLTPPVGITLTPGSIIDISHESLMRCWGRLIDWSKAEAESADFYIRLSRDAAWYEAGRGSLWDPPELDLGERWRAEAKPTAAWAQRYADRFDRAIAFLDRSRAAHHAAIDEAERARRSVLRRTQAAAIVLAVLLVAAVWSAVVARQANQRAAENFKLAADNFNEARAAVDASLASVDMNPNQLGTDVPELTELRSKLLGKAAAFYTKLAASPSATSEARHDVAVAHLRLGQISRQTNQLDVAEQEIVEAIKGLNASTTGLQGDSRDRLAEANNELGWVLTDQDARFMEAKAAFDRAVTLQQEATAGPSADSAATIVLGKFLNNRGILLHKEAMRPGRENSKPALDAQAEKDFSDAIARLTPLKDKEGAALELARTYNNLAAVKQDSDDAQQAEQFYRQGIVFEESLLKSDPTNREYKIELAKFCNNLASLLGPDKSDEATRFSERAEKLLNELETSSTIIDMDLADTFTVRGDLLANSKPKEAERNYTQAWQRFEGLLTEARQPPDFPERFGNLVISLVEFNERQPASGGARQLLSRAAKAYAEMIKLRAAAASKAEIGTLSYALKVALDNRKLPDDVRRWLNEAQLALQQTAKSGR